MIHTVDGAVMLYVPKLISEVSADLLSFDLLERPFRLFAQLPCLLKQAHARCVSFYQIVCLSVCLSVSLELVDESDSSASECDSDSCSWLEPLAQARLPFASSARSSQCMCLRAARSLLNQAHGLQQLAHVVD